MEELAKTIFDNFTSAHDIYQVSGGPNGPVFKLDDDYEEILAEFMDEIKEEVLDLIVTNML